MNFACLRLTELLHNRILDKGFNYKPIEKIDLKNESGNALFNLSKCCNVKSLYE